MDERKYEYYLNGVKIDPNKIEFLESGEGLKYIGMYFKGSNENLLLPSRKKLEIREIK